MQVFGNLASPIQRKTTKAGKDYAEFRLAESQRSQPGSASDEATWYTVRVMKGNVPEFVKGDFVKVTGKLKTDFYLSREGKPTGTLLIIAFEASKIAKPSTVAVAPAGEEQVAPKVEPKTVVPAPQRAPEPVPERPAETAQETVREPVQEYESDWSCLYD